MQIVKKALVICVVSIQILASPDPSPRPTTPPEPQPDDRITWFYMK